MDHSQTAAVLLPLSVSKMISYSHLGSKTQQETASSKCTCGLSVGVASFYSSLLPGISSINPGRERDTVGKSMAFGVQHTRI